MLRSVALLISGNAFGWLFLFARNLLVARLISVEDYGIAATFALSMAVVEMMSGLGIQQLIVQDKKGEDPRFQAALQGFHLLRSVISAAILFLLAHPIARFLGIPDLAWVYQVLALIPLIRGFEHFDMHRLNRRNIYMPILLHTAIPAVVSVVSVLPLAAMFGDYQVMLYAMIVQWVLAVAVSHVMARRRYALVWDVAIVRQCLTFGWPILISNVMLFFVLQGDKAVVAREMGMETLAIFAMGVTLTMVPTLVLAKSLQMLFLPRLSQAQDDQSRFQDLSMAAIQSSLMGGVLLVAATLVLAEPFIRVTLGEKYAPLIPLMVWLAIQQAMRGFKVGSTIAALARKHTSNAMIANAVRLIALPCVWYVAAGGGSLRQIILIGIAGELASFAVSLWLVRDRLGVSLRAVALPVVACLLHFVLVAFHILAPAALTGSRALEVAGLCLLLPLVFLTMPQLRAHVLRRPA